MALTWALEAHSEVGLVRKTNQDSAYASATMIMVADGMGGAAAGDLASTVAIRELRRTDESLAERLASAAEAAPPEAAPEAAAVPAHEAAPEAAPSDAAAAGEPDATESAPTDLGNTEAPHSGRDAVLAVLAGALQRANDTLAELVEDDAELEGMGTTVCGAMLHDDALALVNIGDSRAYRYRDGRLERLTRDHSWVQTLVDDGRITEEEALEHPHRSLILRVLNGSPTHSPDLAWTDLRPGDRLLVCSDGLCGLVTDAQIAGAMGTESRADTVAALVKLAHDAGGHDNITMVLADIEIDGPAAEARVLGAAEYTAVPTAEHTLTIEATASGPAPAAARAGLTEEERYALQGRRRPSAWLRMALGFLIPLLALAGGGATWYQFTQTQYFIGVDGDSVALYRGVPDTVLGLPLSEVVLTGSTRVADLPPYYANQVRATIPVGGLPAARTTMTELSAKAAACVAQRAARATQPPVEPVPADPADPTVPGDPGVTGEPSPVSGPVTSTEDC